MGYKAKYLLDHDKGEMKGYEVNKIVNGIESETSKPNPISIITAVLVASLIVYLFIR